MPFASLVTVTAALAGLAVAAPNKAFVVHQSVERPGKAPQIHLANTYAKYGATAPKDVIAAAAAVSSGSVTATPESYDTEYLCPVYIGTSGQLLNLDFDTGSSDLWVFSTRQPSGSASGHSTYNPASSSSSVLKSGYSWKISYGDGSGASGVVYSDKVAIGPVTVTSQAVEAATSVSSSFSSDTDNDGLVGLAFSSINTVQPQQQNTFFDTAINQGLPSKVFTADLKKGKAGSYGFGYVDSSKYTGSIVYTAVDNSQGFWGFTATGYGIGTGAFMSTSLSGIADTGTTLLLLPDSVVNAYYAKVSGAKYSSAAGGYVFSCSATLPSFVVGISGTKFTIPGSYINFAPNGDGTCYGGLQSSSGIGINIFGDVFLKAIFAVFDKNSSPRLGIAAKNLS